MAQHARPDSDVSAGGWTAEGGPSSLYDCLNESSPDDGDYIEATANATCELGLSEVTDPESGAGHVLRWRMQGNGSAAPERCRAYLYEGATLRAAGGLEVSRGAWATQEYTLDAAEADSITDYTNLSIKIDALSLGEGETMWVSWAEFEVPDAPAGGVPAQAMYHRKRRSG